MRRFDYNCKACKFVFEYIQETCEHADDCPHCPSCGSKRVIRELCLPAVHNFYSPMHPRAKRGMCKDKNAPKMPRIIRPLFTREDLPSVKRNKRAT